MIISEDRDRNRLHWPVTRQSSERGVMIPTSTSCWASRYGTESVPIADSVGLRSSNLAIPLVLEGPRRSAGFPPSHRERPAQRAVPNRQVSLKCSRAPPTASLRRHVPPVSTVPADTDRHVGVVSQERNLADARRSRRPQEPSFELSVAARSVRGRSRMSRPDALPDIRIPSEIVMFRPFRDITHASLTAARIARY